MHRTPVARSNGGREHGHQTLQYACFEPPSTIGRAQTAARAPWPDRDFPHSSSPNPTTPSLGHYALHNAIATNPSLSRSGKRSPASDNRALKIFLHFPSRNTSCLIREYKVDSPLPPDLRTQTSVSSIAIAQAVPVAATSAQGRRFGIVDIMASGRDRAQICEDTPQVLSCHVPIERPWHSGREWAGAHGASSHHLHKSVAVIVGNTRRIRSKVCARCGFSSVFENHSTAEGQSRYVFAVASRCVASLTCRDSHQKFSAEHFWVAICESQRIHQDCTFGLCHIVARVFRQFVADRWYRSEVRNDCSQIIFAKTMEVPRGHLRI